jgi:hypothetical protein
MRNRHSRDKKNRRNRKNCDLSFNGRMALIATPASPDFAKIVVTVVVVIVTVAVTAGFIRLGFIYLMYVTHKYTLCFLE